MTATTEPRSFSEEEIQRIRLVLETPGKHQGDACESVGIPRNNRNSLTRALDRAGYDIVLTIKKRGKRP